MYTTNIKKHTTWVVMIVFGLTLANTVIADDWQPLSSERLIRLPAPVMAKALEQDFRNSDLALSLDTSNDNLGDIRNELKQLSVNLGRAEAQEIIPARHDVLKKKSAYLDEMEKYQRYQRQVASTKVKIYEELLKDLQRNRRRANDPVSREVRAAQLASRARMKANRKRVDDNLFPATVNADSRYAQEYEGNLSKIKQLQVAIRNHQANRNASLDGEEVSREAFVRHLLAEAETDIALLDQEDEMLGYMARLVALDAQSLQMEVAYGEENQDVSMQSQRKPRNMVELFIN